MAEKPFKVKNDLVVGRSIIVDSDLTVKGNSVVEGTLQATSLTGVYTGFDSDFADKSTTDLTEGSNLYYTTARADSAFDVRLATKTTDDVSEGTTNLYYLTSRFDSDLGNKTTADLTEGSNLYYTTQRADSDFDVRLSTKSTTDLTEGDNLYYTTARADSDAKRSISVTDNGGDGSLSYNPATGVISYTGPSATEVRAHLVAGTGVTYDSTSGVISIGQAVETTSDVTFGRVTGDSAVLNGINFNAVTQWNPGAGALYWDSDPQKGLSFKPTTNEGNTDVTLNIGQETLIYVHNLTGETIANGDVVYISGTAHGLHPQVTKAQANAAVSGNLAVATMDIVDNAHGYVTRFGLVRDVNTGGMTPGADIYLSYDSAGKWTTTSVSVDSGYPFHLGKVVRVDSATGSILVDPFTEHYEYLRIQDRLKVTGTIEATTIMVDSAIQFSLIDYLKRPAHSEGKIWYDEDAHTLSVHTDDSSFVNYLGEREWVRVRNSSGSLIPKGTPVYQNGVHIPGHPIHGHHPLIYPADASDPTKYEVIGITAHDIDNGAHGFAVVRGYIDNIDTSSLTSGTRFHLAPGGGFQDNAPSYPNFPVDLGFVLTSDSVGGGGTLYVNIVDHTMEEVRITGDGRIDGNLTIGGNLNVVGVTTSAITQSVEVSSNFLKLLEGNTLGTAYQNYNLTGLNDATFVGSYRGDSNIFYFIDIVATDSVGGGGDTIRFGISDSDTIGEGQYGVPFDSAGSGKTTWQLGTDGLIAPLRNNISIQFINATGHVDSDLWCAHPTELNLDLGFVGNYNPPGLGGIKYAGFFRDVSDARWKFFEGLTQNLDSGFTDVITDSAGFTLSDIQFDNAYGNLTGNVTGNATTASLLDSARTFSITGDITAAGISFDGGADVTFNAAITAGSIVNADINAAAAIADTKLATISTVGKVQNSATTATSSNTGSAIVARDPSGNFSAGTITASLTGNVTGNVTGTVSSLSNHTTSALAEGSNLYYTTVRADSDFDVRLATKTTTDVAEGSNLYYTTSRADSDFDVRLATKTTDNVTEGTTNLYYTTARADSDARHSVSVTDVGGDGSLTYSAATGVFTYTGPSASEVRAHFSGTSPVVITDGAISVNDATTSTKGIASFNSASFAVSSGDVTIKSAGVTNTQLVNSSITINGSSVSLGGTRTLVTDDIAEDGSPVNQWFTNTRARAAVSVTDNGGDGSLTYSSLTGVITYTGPSASEVRSHFNVNDNNLAYDSATGKFTFGATPSFTSITLSVATGTAPMTVSSTTLVSNLNADLLDGQEGSYYRIDVYDAAGSLLN